MSKLQETRFQLQNSKNCNIYLFIFNSEAETASIHILISGEPKYNVVWVIFSLILRSLEQ